MKTIYQKSVGLTKTPLHYCPGCTHGIIHKLVAETIIEYGMEGKTIGVAPVGHLRVRPCFKKTFAGA